MTEIDPADQEPFVPPSKVDEEETNQRDPSTLAHGRIYNDFPESITVVRASGGKTRHLVTVAPRSSTEADWWETDELWLTINTGLKYHVDFQPLPWNGPKLTYQYYRRLPAGTTNATDLVRGSLSETAVRDEAVQSPENIETLEAPEAQQIPITITAPDLPAPAVDARDALLAAIAAEAQTITAKQSGKGAEALETLARAYLLVSGGAATVPPSSRMRNLTVGHGISASSGEYVDMVIPE